MKTYILKGKNGKPDIDFALGDLIPLKQTKPYDFVELVKLVDYSHYHSDTNWTNEDYISLYRKPGNQGRDFFMIRDTGVIVIPGSYLFPTLLTANQIR